MYYNTPNTREFYNARIVQRIALGMYGYNTSWNGPGSTVVRGTSGRLPIVSGARAAAVSRDMSSLKIRGSAAAAAAGAHCTVGRQSGTLSVVRRVCVRGSSVGFKFYGPRSAGQLLMLADGRERGAMASPYMVRAPVAAG